MAWVSLNMHAQTERQTASQRAPKLRVGRLSPAAPAADFACCCRSVPVPPSVRQFIKLQQVNEWGNRARLSGARHGEEAHHYSSLGLAGVRLALCVALILHGVCSAGWLG